MSTLIESQDTQEASNGSCDNLSNDTSGFWGRLLSLNDNKHITLIKDEVVIGRRPDCDYLLSDLKISAIHCKVIKQNLYDYPVVYLEDFSSNGTFLNGKLVGKGKKTILKNSDKISLSTKTYTDPMVYTFVTNFSSSNTIEDEVQSKYELRKTLGMGSSSVVLLGVNRQTGEEFAIKRIDKKKSWNFAKAREQMIAEVEILRKLEHPNIIRIIEVVDTPKFFYIVLELARGGELFDRIREKGGFKEKDAKPLFKQILTAVAYLHSQNITHRDLKPENILLVGKNTSTVKITDFGLAKIIGEKEKTTTLCGTPMYVAPEVLGVLSDKRGSVDLSHGYSKQVDAWSLGCILYVVLSNHPPFDDGPSLYEQIRSGSILFDPKIWGGVSNEAKDLISKLLSVDPMKRLTVDQALNHAWFEKEPQNTSLPSSSSETNKKIASFDFRSPQGKPKCRISITSPVKIAAFTPQNNNTTITPQNVNTLSLPSTVIQNSIASLPLQNFATSTPQNILSPVFSDSLPNSPQTNTTPSPGVSPSSPHSNLHFKNSSKHRHSRKRLIFEPTTNTTSSPISKNKDTTENNTNNIVSVGDTNTPKRKLQTRLQTHFKKSPPNSILPLEKSVHVHSPYKMRSKAQTTSSPQMIDEIEIDAVGLEKSPLIKIGKSKR